MAYEPNKESIAAALHAAVSALYLNDSSDYESALREVVRELGGQEILEQMGTHAGGHLAFKQTYCAAFGRELD